MSSSVYRNSSMIMKLDNTRLFRVCLELFIGGLIQFLILRIQELDYGMWPCS